MKKTLLTLIILMIFPFRSMFADEGMWIPMLLEQLNEKEMREMGMRITAEDIYSINKASLKDAIVLFGGGCTGEIVSDQGLLLTNHHCGYGSIQRHSSIEHDYLTDGFWAKNQEEELSCPWLSVILLREMKDITEAVLDGVTDQMTTDERNDKIELNKRKLIREAEKETDYHAEIEGFYLGNQYFMLYMEIFKDVRLVGTPPSNIGKFGGDTDNWMWPRHTGDFSVFRIYADKDNKPTEYSAENKPYKPAYHLPISLKGCEKDDFTFVFGYPARTNEYATSYEINLRANIINPVRIKLRETRLDIFGKYADNDPKVRIQYASKDAGVANTWKKMIGESKGIREKRGVERKQAFEKDFIAWVNQNTVSDYKKLIPAFEKEFSELEPYEKAFYYIYEAGYGVELFDFVSSFEILIPNQNLILPEGSGNSIEKMERRTKSFFKDYYMPIDKEVAEALLTIYKDEQPADFRPDFLNEIDKKFNGNVKSYVDYLFEKSIFTSQEKVENFLKSYTDKKYKKILNDPAYKAYMSLQRFGLQISNKLQISSNRLDSLRRIYMRAQMEMQPQKHFYPDANFTLRVSYGKVCGFEPKDAVTYSHFTTLDGIMAKENPDIYDYVVEKRLKDLYKAKDYGRYADKDGSMHVAFVASNHTTGGNSGSPILNADGQLLGLNFDRCWEGTMSDLIYDPTICRNISVDIRYVLFIIDKFAGARHLVDEMTIVE